MMKEIGAGFLVVVVIGLCNLTFGGFILLSIVCTAGIALVVWIPLFGLICAVVLKVLNVIRSEKKETAMDFRAPAEPLTREQFGIERYIDRAKACGDSREHIESALRNGGWSDAEIQAAYGG